jgi:hypothetical protein
MQQQAAGKVITPWVRYPLIALIFEKIVQHITVTVAFYFNWANIAASVVLNPNLLMVLGAVVAVLFAIGCWGIISRQTWAIKLVIALAFFDILGEFAAQGTIAIAITVSFLVALILLILAFLYQRQAVQSTA